MRTYCFKLYKSKKNKKLHNLINLAGFIYNHCIALYKRYYHLYKKHINKFQLQAHLAKLKKCNRFAFFKNLGSQAVQNIVERIDNGYKLFFRNRKHKLRASTPSFKKVRKYKSFTLKTAGYKYLGRNVVVINKVRYKFFKSRDIEGKIKNLTVKRDVLGDIYIYFICEDNSNEVLKRTGKSVGYDFGLKRFLTASDEEFDVEAPEFFKNNSEAIRKANKNLSKKQKGSNHRKYARLRLAKIHKKTVNQRKDYHYKLARKICEEFSLICVEDLNIKAMQRRWGRKISDLGFYSFVQILKYEAQKLGCHVEEIPRFYPSSKTCNKCKYILDELPLKIREWKCPKCGSVHDRDRNAALNIWEVGTSTYLGRLCKT